MESGNNRWELAWVIYIDICAKLTKKQYFRWAMITPDDSWVPTYVRRLRVLSAVTKNKRLLKLAKAALYELERI